MKMNLDDALDEILLKNHVASKRYEQFVKAKKVLKNEYRSICDRHNRVAVIAVSEDDAEEFEKATKNSVELRVDDVFFIDEYFEKISEILSKIRTYDAVCVISFNEHSYLCDLIMKEAENTEVYDIYDWFLKADLYFECEFYKIGEYIHEYYKETFTDKRKYIHTKDPVLKKKYHQMIIQDYLVIRDFLHAFRWIDSYVLNYPNDVNYVTLKKDLITLLEDIKEKLYNRKQKDIIIEWIDALEIDELEDMPYLSGIKKDGLYLSNSGTVTPWTVATMWTVLMKKKAVDDHEFLLEKDKLAIDKSDLVQHLRLKGMEFYYIGGNASLIFQKQGCPQYFGRWSHTFCNNQWLLLQTLLENEKPCCVLIHNIMETHFPNICPELEDDYVIYYKNRRAANPQIKKKKVFETANRYLDEQMRFFMDFIPDASKLYMSDHGKGEIFNRWRTVTIIDAKDGKKGKEERLFSLYNFDNLIAYLAEPTHEKYESIFSEYLEIQDTDIYGWDYEMLSRNPISIDHLLGYRGICTKEYMYLKRNDGKKILYRFPEKVNIIDDPNSKRTIDEMDKVIGNYQIDINEYDYFKNSRLIRKAIACYHERVGKGQKDIENKLKEILADIPKDAIGAIRGGGEHTQNLLRVIGNELNIKYIIDKKLDQIYKTDKYGYLKPQEIKNIDVDYVIISSYGHRNDMRDELLNNLFTGRIIDIYEELGKRGIILNQPFYGAELIEPQDFKKAKSIMEECN